MTQKPPVSRTRDLDKISPKKRLKAGRKPVGDNSERTNRIPRTVRIDKDILELAQALCWWQRVSFNEWTESLLLDQIKIETKILLESQGVEVGEILKKFRKENDK